MELDQEEKILGCANFYFQRAVWYISRISPNKREIQEDGPKPEAK